MAKVSILSRTSAPFRDRDEAGVLLGAALGRFQGDETVVLGIPRGGVIVAAQAARALKAGLDIALSRKLGAPGNPELAIGAISESGEVFLDEAIAAHALASREYIDKETAQQSSEIKRRAGTFRKILPKVSLAGKTVILVDDGLATGATMAASLAAARREAPKRLVAAVPVASAEAIEKIADYCDEVVVLRLPEFFAAVGEFYRDFGQTDDEEVAGLLRREALRRAG